MLLFPILNVFLLIYFALARTLSTTSNKISESRDPLLGLTLGRKSIKYNFLQNARPGWKSFILSLLKAFIGSWWIFLMFLFCNYWERSCQKSVLNLSVSSIKHLSINTNFQFNNSWMADRGHPIVNMAVAVWVQLGGRLTWMETWWKKYPVFHRAYIEVCVESWETINW